MAVCGTGHRGSLWSARGFSRQPGHYVTSDASAAPPAVGQRFCWHPAFPGCPPPRPQPPLSIRAADLACCVPPLPDPPWAQDCLPARHRLRCDQPRLRSRLTLGRSPLPRNPQASGVGGSHTHSRYSFRHSRFGSLQVASRSPFSATPERSPTTLRSRCGRRKIRGFGAGLEPRVIVGAGTLDQ